MPVSVLQSQGPPSPQTHRPPPLWGNTSNESVGLLAASMSLIFIAVLLSCQQLSLQFSLRPNCSKLCRACLPLQGKHHKRYNGRQREIRNMMTMKIKINDVPVPGLFPSACRSINRPGLFLLNPAPGLIPAAAYAGIPLPGFAVCP